LYRRTIIPLQVIPHPINHLDILLVLFLLFHIYIIKMSNLRENIPNKRMPAQHGRKILKERETRKKLYLLLPSWRGGQSPTTQHKHSFAQSTPLPLDYEQHVMA
jgi:hypothetical protein